MDTTTVDLVRHARELLTRAATTPDRDGPGARPDHHLTYGAEGLDELARVAALFPQIMARGAQGGDGTVERLADQLAAALTAHGNLLRRRAPHRPASEGPAAP